MKRRIISRSICVLLTLAMLLGMGAVSLTTHAAVANELEINNTYATANIITPGNGVTGTLSTYDDDDYFKLTTTANGKLSINFCHTFEDSGYGWDIYVYRYISGSYYELSKTSIDLRDNEKVILPYVGAVKGGVYYIKVDNNYSIAGKKYTINTSFAASSIFEKEINETFATANTLEMNKTYHGNIGKNDDYDYFKLVAPSNGKISVSFCHTYADSSSEWSVLLYRYVSGAYQELSHNYIELNDNEVEPLPFIGAVANGVYYIKIERNWYSDIIGTDYSLKIAFAKSDYYEKEVNNVYSNATAAKTNATYAGTINSSDDKDCYKIVTPTAGKLNIDFIHNFENSYDDWDIEVFNYSGGAYNSVATANIDLNTDKTQRVYSAKVKANKVYYVVVSRCCSGVVGRPYSVKIGFASTGSQLATPKITGIVNAVNGVKLTWGKVSGAPRYRVFIKSGGTWKKLGDTTSNTFVHKAAKSATKYTYTVRCMSKDGGTYTSSFNSKGWAITFIAAPKNPTLKNLKSGVYVTFKRVAGAAKYRLYRKIGSGKWVGIATIKSGYIDKTAKRGVTYRYTLRCMNKNGKLISAANAGAAIKCTR